MKLQNLTVIFIIIIIPVILLVSLYISTGLKTIKYQSLYDTGLLTATHSAISAFELNTTNDAYSDNAETKRNILKSSVKMFEKSLANTCNISSYNTDEIEEYIPAIVFGMYDGFYMYAPSYNSKTGKYEHDLKNYVYYSETLDDGTIIMYSLDNYIVVSGKFNGKYMVKEGYLIDLNSTTEDGKKYKGIDINPEIIDGQENTEGINYYKDAYKFTKWFKENVADKADYLGINSDNDPEDETSSFVQHKREIIKNKIESVLNSSITAYSERTWGRTYKMPKLSEEDWQKIYSNISMITFFQGKNIGLTKYNGYCVLNSTNSNEYVNPNLMYFIDDSNEYHDIRCSNKSSEELKGYKIGDFQKVKLEKVLNADGTPETDENGNQLYDNDGTKTTSAYKYKHSALACYECVNGSLATNTSVYSYVNPYYGTADPKIKTSYWTSLARERYRTTKLIDSSEETDSEPEIEEPETYTVTYIVDGVEYRKQQANISEKIKIITDEPQKNDHTFCGWFNFFNMEYVAGQEIEYNGESEIKLYAKWKKEKIKVSYIKDGAEIYYKNIDNTGNYEIEQLENIDKTNYIFKGWKYNIDGKIYKIGENVQYSTEIEELVLTATYNQKDYKITIQTLGKITTGLTNSSVSYAKKGMNIIAKINQDVKITLEINDTSYEGISTIGQEITEPGKYTITARATLNGETVSDTKTVYIGEENNNLDFKLGRLVTASGGNKCVFYDSDDEPFTSAKYIIMSQDLDSQFHIESIEKLSYKEDVKPLNILQGVMTRGRYYVSVFPNNYQGLTGISGKKIVIISEDSSGNIISINILQGV